MMQVPPTITPETARRVADALAENGRVLATLDDWRAILFVFVVVLLIMVAVVITLLRANRAERRDMAAERERMWGVADKFGDAAGKLTSELQVQQVLNARVETALGRCEDLLQQPRRPHGKRT